jgi:hypothetical protein
MYTTHKLVHELRYILSQITYNRKTKGDVDIGLSGDLGLSGDGPLHRWPHQACCYFHRALVQNECLENVPTEMKIQLIWIKLHWRHSIQCSKETNSLKKENSCKNDDMNKFCWITKCVLIKKFVVSSFHNMFMI